MKCTNKNLLLKCVYERRGSINVYYLISRCLHVHHGLSQHHGGKSCNNHGSGAQAVDVGAGNHDRSTGGLGTGWSLVSRAASAGLFVTAALGRRRRVARAAVVASVASRVTAVASGVAPITSRVTAVAAAVLSIALVAAVITIITTVASRVATVAAVVTAVLPVALAASAIAAVTPRIAAVAAAILPIAPMVSAIVTAAVAAMAAILTAGADGLGRRRGRGLEPAGLGQGARAVYSTI